MCTILWVGTLLHWKTPVEDKREDYQNWGKVICVPVALPANTSANTPAEGNQRFHLWTKSLWIPITKPGRTPPIMPTLAFNFFRIREEDQNCVSQLHTVVCTHTHTHTYEPLSQMNVDLGLGSIFCVFFVSFLTLLRPDCLCYG